MRRKRGVVIGAGVGGLVAALLLAAANVEVLVLERAATPGGKLRQIDGIDAGPTVFTMRWVFDEIFASAGAALDDHLALSPLRILARHAWSGTERLDLFADEAASADAIGRFAGPTEARGYIDFCARARRTYRTLEAPFLRAANPSPLSLAREAGLGGLGDLWRIAPFATLWRALGENFADPRLRQLFGRYATYCGSSPFLAPATLMLIAHVEQAGVWSVDGGMHRIARALQALAEARGTSFRFAAEAAEIVATGGKVTGVRLASGEVVPADAVIANADVAALSAGRFGRAAAAAVPPAPFAARSLSALTWAVRARTEGFPLHRHNVFFGADYEGEFADLVRLRRLPRMPTIYVCAQDRGDDAAPPDGPERLLILANAPATGDAGPPSPAELAACEAAGQALMARCGLEIEAAPATMTGPREFEALFPATGGGLYGGALHGWQASFRRPRAATRLPGLYLAGGSAHPGAGVPMAALSGRHAAAAVLAGFAR